MSLPLLASVPRHIEEAHVPLQLVSVRPSLRCRLSDRQPQLQQPYSPPHNLYPHLYSQSSSSSTSSSTASSLSFHPARTYPSSSFLPAFTASIHTSPDSTSHDLSAPPSPLSSSRSLTVGAGVGALTTASLFPSYRSLQPLEAFPTSTRAAPSPCHRRCRVRHSRLSPRIRHRSCK